MGRKKKKRRQAGQTSAPARPRPPAAGPPAAGPGRNRWLLAAGGAVVVVIAAGLLVMRPGKEATGERPRLPVARVDGATLPLEIVERHAERVALVPEQALPYRPLAEHFRAAIEPRGVLFAYPDDSNRSVQLDPDRRRQTVGLVFLARDGTVDSVHTLEADEALALSEGLVRFALFVPGTWLAAHGIRVSTRIELPAEATEAAARAEPEWTPITDPPPATIRIGGAALRVEIAHKAALRNRGLMYRSYIREGTGMLFLFREPREQRFWMRNTRTSLDIAYVGDDFRITNVVTMQAHDLDRGKRYRSEGPVRIALETGAGFFAKHGIGRGSLVELPENVKALLEGADP